MDVCITMTTATQNCGGCASLTSHESLGVHAFRVLMDVCIATTIAILMQNFESESAASELRA